MATQRVDNRALSCAQKASKACTAARRAASAFEGKRLNAGGDHYFAAGQRLAQAIVELANDGRGVVGAGLEIIVVIGHGSFLHGFGPRKSEAAHHSLASMMVNTKPAFSSGSVAC